MSTTELRLMLVGAKRPDIKIHLLLPTKDSKLVPEKLTDGWPRAYGFWEGTVWGMVEWDEENQLLLIYWSDEDLNLVDITPRIDLRKDRRFSFYSHTHGVDTEMVTTELVVEDVVLP